MKSNIKAIVGELLELEPSLQEKKKEVEKIVKQLLESKPDITIDTQFKNELRYMLKQKIQATAVKAVTKKTPWLQGVWYALGGAVMASLILTPGFYFYYSPQQNAFVNSVPQMKQTESSFMMMDTAMDDASFAPEMDMGEIEENMDIMNEEDLEEEVEMEKAMTRSIMPVEPGIGGGGGLPLDGDERFAGPQSYQLSYSGAGFVVEGDERNIYKRGDAASAVNVSQVLAGLDIPQINVSALEGDLSFETLTVFEDKKYGHGIQISQQGEVMIQQNWRTWPDPYAQCKDQACYDAQQMSLSDIPTDKQVIAMAQDLLDKFDVDVSTYGKPEIDNTWRERQGEKIAYVPDTLTVTYPEILEEKFVYDQSGEKTGIKVNVNIRYNKAASIWGMNVADLAAGSVGIVKDLNTLIKHAEGGGVNVYVPQYVKGDVRSVDLAQPEEVYVKLWDFDPNTKLGTSVYVPALRFELGNRPDNVGLYQNNVFVPLVEEYWDKQGGYPELMRDGH